MGAISIHRDLLLTGSRDKKLMLQDFRCGHSEGLQFNGPKQEICGLKWSPDGDYFAVGSNDNSLMVFSPKTRFAIMKKRHKAAVKAIAWSPNHRGMLASGGGTADCMIKLWNVGRAFFFIVFPETFGTGFERKSLFQTWDLFPLEEGPSRTRVISWPQE